MAAREDRGVSVSFTVLPTHLAYVYALPVARGPRSHESLLHVTGAASFVPPSCAFVMPGLIHAMGTMDVLDVWEHKGSVEG